MIKKINAYSRKYEVDFGRLTHGKIAKDYGLRKVYGEAYDHLLVRGNSENLILIERDFKKKKEIIKVHSENPEAIQSQLEKITGINFSQYRVDYIKMAENKLTNAERKQEVFSQQY